MSRSTPSSSPPPPPVLDYAHKRPWRFPFDPPAAAKAIGLWARDKTDALLGWLACLAAAALLPAVLPFAFVLGRWGWGGLLLVAVALHALAWVFVVRQLTRVRRVTAVTWLLVPAAAIELVLLYLCVYGWAWLMLSGR